jgi:hypothetical protein
LKTIVKTQDKQVCYNIITVPRALTGRKRIMNKYLDTEKALETVVYVSHETNNLFNIVKTLYFADKFHLESYGRLITGDYYVAMEDGPVPSGAYDLIKLVRGDNFSYEPNIVNAHPETAIRVVKIGKDTEVSPLRPPDLDYFSESDLECLNKAIKLFARMDVLTLWDRVHKEDAYKKTLRDKPIKLQDIILSLPNGKEIIEYLNS